MSIVRVVCKECGLAATHIRSGDRGVTSINSDECIRRCARAREARDAGEPVIECTAKCEHLLTALAAPRS